MKIPVLLLLIGILCFSTKINGQVFKSKLKYNTNNNAQKLGIKDIQRGNGIYVSSPRYDNIGQILSKIGFQYKPYSGSLSDAKMLFINCGTSTKIAVNQLRTFVNNGGILYASDLTDQTISAAFPGLFNFKRGGSTGTIMAQIRDNDLQNILGNSIDIHFDLGGWAVLNSINAGDVLMEANGKPIMVSVPYGNGTIFYTCFHNHKQASDKEEALLKLLLTKQVQELAQLSFEDTAKEMGLDLNAMKNHYKN